VGLLGPNADRELLQPARVTDCYLGLLVLPEPVGEPEAGTVLVVAPATLLPPDPPAGRQPGLGPETGKARCMPLRLGRMDGRVLLGRGLGHSVVVRP
jgi:hypothetical protein